MNAIKVSGTSLLAVLLCACGPSQDASAPAASDAKPAVESDKVAPTRATSVDESLPIVIVHKSESCGCCSDWVKHMERAGFRTEVHNVDNLNAIKEAAGIPPAMGSCHTARVGKYFVEGHVPAEDVKRLLAEQPDAKGLTVPRMPIGSPGMETPTGEVEPYDVFLVAGDGSTSVYAQHGK